MIQMETIRAYIQHRQPTDPPAPRLAERRSPAVLQGRAVARRGWHGSGTLAIPTLGCPRKASRVGEGGSTRVSGALLVPKIGSLRMFVAHDMRLSVDVLQPSMHGLPLVASPDSPLLAIGAMDAVSGIRRYRPTCVTYVW